MARKAVKILHVLGSTALTGALAAYMLLLATASSDSLAEYANLRANLATLSKWVIAPSMVLCLASGMFTLVVHHPFQEQRWVWIKILLGLPMFEGTLGVVDAVAQRAARLTAEAAAGGGDPAVLAELVRTEWGGLWAIMGLARVNIVISVWRPRLRGKRRTA